MRINLQEIKLFVISLETSTKRREHIIEEFSKRKLEPIIINAIEDDISIVGCTKSHKKILFKNVTPFAIFEDDITIMDFPMEFTIPDNTDAVYLGISNYYDNGLPNKNGPSVYPLSKSFGKIENMLSAHGILYLNPRYVQHSLRICDFSINSKIAHDIYLSMTQQFFNVLSFIKPMVYQDAKVGGQEKQTNDTLTRFIKSIHKDDRQTADVRVITLVNNITYFYQYINLLKIIKLSYPLAIFCNNESKWFLELRANPKDIVFSYKNILKTNESKWFLELRANPKDMVFSYKNILKTNNIIKNVSDESSEKYILWISIYHLWIDISKIDEYISRYPNEIHFIYGRNHDERLTIFNRSFPNNESYRVWFSDPYNAIDTIKDTKLMMVCQQFISEYAEQVTGEYLGYIFLEYLKTCKDYIDIRYQFNRLYTIHRDFYINIQNNKVFQNNLSVSGIAFVPKLNLPLDSSVLDCYVNNATIFIELGNHLTGIIVDTQNKFRKIHCIEKSRKRFCSITGAESNIEIAYNNNITVYHGKPIIILPFILATVDDNAIFFLHKDQDLLAEIDQRLNIPAIIICNNPEDSYQFTRCRVNKDEINVYNRVIHVEPPEKLVGMLIFSKDRPLQLTALLDSISSYTKIANINILYLASSEDSQKAYDNMIGLYSQHSFIKECDFHRQTRDIINNYKYIVFMVDDSLIVRKFSINDCIRILENNDNVIGVSLRLGKNTLHSFNMNTDNPFPEIVGKYGSLLFYDWTNAIGVDFSYSMEISSSVYRTIDIIALLETRSFSKPNDLEDVLAKYRKTINRPLLAIYETSIAFSIPYNIVQSTHTNRKAIEDQTNAESLLTLYNMGMRIDIAKHHNYVSSGCHDLVKLYMIPTKKCVVS
jgi:hypothetical protein